MATGVIPPPPWEAQNIPPPPWETPIQRAQDIRQDFSQAPDSPVEASQAPTVSQVAQGRYEANQRLQAKDEQTTLDMAKYFHVSPKTMKSPVFQAAASAVTGLNQFVYSQPLTIFQKIGAATGLYDGKTQLAQHIDAASQYLGDQSTANLLSAFVGENVLIGVPIIKGAIGAVGTGITLANTFTKAGFAVGAGIQGALVGLDYAAATPEERKDLLQNVPQQAVAIIGFGLIGSMLGGVQGQTKANYEAAKLAFAEKIPDIKPESVAPAMASVVESGVPYEPNFVIQRYEFPVPINTQKLLVAGEPGRTVTASSLESVQRVEGTYAALQEAGVQQAGAAKLVNDMPEMPAAGSTRGVVTQTVLEELQRTAEDKRAVANEKRAWADPNAETPLEVGPTVNVNQRKPGYTESPQYRKDLIASMKAEIEARDAERQYQIASKLTPDNMADVAINARTTALEAQRNAMSFARAAELEHAQALADFKALHGVEYSEYPWPSEEIVKHTQETGAEGQIDQRAHVDARLKNLVNATAEVKADAAEMQKTQSEKYLAAREKSLENHGITSDMPTMLRETLAAIKEADDIPPVSPVTSPTKRSFDLKDAFSHVINGTKTLTSDISKIFAEKLKGNQQFIEGKYLSEHAYENSVDAIYQIRQALKEKKMDAGTRASFAAAFSEEGHTAILLENEKRIAAGQPPVWNKELEALRSIEHKLAKQMHDVQAGWGVIEADDAISRLASFFTNPEKALNFITVPEGEFSLSRSIDALFKAAEKGKGEITLRSTEVADLIPGMLGKLAADVNRAQVRYIARKVPGAYLTTKEWTRLATEDRGKYQQIYTNDWVQKDVFHPGRQYFEKAITKSFTEEAAFRTKQVVLGIDLQHIRSIGLSVATHPSIFLHPELVFDAYTGKLASDPVVMRGVQRHGLNVRTLGGDFQGTLAAMLPKSLVGELATLSHTIVFDKTMPPMKMLTFKVAIQKALSDWHNGNYTFRGMTENQVWDYTVKRVNKEFGTVNFRNLGVSAKFQRAVQTLLLAPEWNASIMSTVWGSLREMGQLSRGNVTDFYATKRFTGMAVTAALTAATVNTVMGKLFGATDYKSPMTTDANSFINSDLFSVVLPVKNPYTHKNLRIGMLGPQFEFWKMAFDAVDAHNYNTKGNPFAAAGTALRRELFGKLGAWIHPWIRLAGGIADREKRTDPIGLIASTIAPFSAAPIKEVADEYFGPGRMVSPQTAIRALSSLTGMRQNWEVPSYVMDDYTYTASKMKVAHKEAAVLMGNGNARGSVDKSQHADDLKREFYGRYYMSEHWNDIRPYYDKLK